MLFSLFKSFFYLGCITFGGGYAMMALITDEISKKQKWIKEKELIDIFAMAQSIPGVISVNIATMVGFKLRGRIGAFVATLGVVLPSFIILLAVAIFFSGIEHLEFVQFVLKGLYGSILALMFTTCLQMFFVEKRTVFMVSLVIFSTILTLLKVNPAYTLISAAILGYIYNK